MEPELSSILTVVHTMQKTRYCQMAVAAVTLYDHVINLGREVDLVWRKKWTLLTYLFLAARYFGNFALLVTTTGLVNTTFDAKVSDHFDQIEAWGTFLVVWFLQGILQMRLYAMYGRSKRALYPMLLCFVAQVVVTVMTLTNPGQSDAIGVTAIPIPGLNYHMCSSSLTKSATMSIYLPSICFEFVLFVMALWVGLQDMVEMRRLSGRWRMNHTMKVLIVYSTLYFLVCVFQLSDDSLHLSAPVIDRVQAATVSSFGLRFGLPVSA
ncbi:hypothetical protein BV22DRAFT_247347 [Leucogyrophana mollusca]|uniref:Uncharacterized protein n=1 Tax=Leucogyrophana mollusca TaxID=85980 RepID=A0ACB8BQG2_9AGAM|nr:hypothetical protein BV22DRAFT_247347 [Leucogyrophana mollusca]